MRNWLLSDSQKCWLMQRGREKERESSKKLSSIMIHLWDNITIATDRNIATNKSTGISSYASSIQAHINPSALFAYLMHKINCYTSRSKCYICIYQVAVSPSLSSCLVCLHFFLFLHSLCNPNKSNAFPSLHTRNFCRLSGVKTIPEISARCGNLYAN